MKLSEPQEICADSQSRVDIGVQCGKFYETTTVVPVQTATGTKLQPDDPFKRPAFCENMLSDCYRLDKEIDAVTCGCVYVWTL